MSEQGISITIKQAPALSAQQIIAINLVGKPTVAVEEYVKKEMENNPALEISDEQPAGDSSGRKSISIESLAGPEAPLSRYGGGTGEATYRNNNFAVQEDFREDLAEQFSYRTDDETDIYIGNYIIQSLDDRGYLPIPTYRISDDLEFYHQIDVSEEKVDEILSIVQSLDPPGIGARDLRECLLLQLERKEHSEITDLATAVVRDCFKELSSRDFKQIMEKLAIDRNTMMQINDCITHLNHSPGGQEEAGSPEDKLQQITPDFVLHYDRQMDKFTLDIPKAHLPAIRISKFTREILEKAALPGASKEDKEAAAFYKARINEAEGLKGAVEQRESILSKTMNSILEFQHEYFKDGNLENLKPMTLEDISSMTGNDVSTISRFSNSKYIETEFGTFPLKYFFSTRMTNKEGEEVSNKEIKQALQNVIDGEDKHNPFTDEQLVDEMDRLGYKLARRTVAKYRSQLNIPVAGRRREI